MRELHIIEFRQNFQKKFRNPHHQKIILKIIITEQDDAPYVVYTKKSDEQINQIRLNRAKTDRARLVDEITVTTTSGNVFDGNELAQNRMARALLGMNETDTMSWVLADNSIVAVTQAELKEALRLSGEAMAALWVKPYIPE